MLQLLIIQMKSIKVMVLDMMKLKRWELALLCGLLFTLPTCQAEDLGTLHLSAPDTGSTRRRRRLYESELRLYLSAPEEPSDT